MARHKGQQPYIKPPLAWDEKGTVAFGIRTGDRWLYAWYREQSVIMVLSVLREPLSPRCSPVFDVGPLAGELPPFGKRR